MDSLPADLGALEDALRSFFQTMKRPQRWATITARAGVTIDRPAGAIIHLLLAHPDRHFRLQDLADSLGIEAPSATRKTQELEKAGYLERLPDAADRRVVSFCLTPSGKQLGKRIQAAQRDFLRIAMSEWSADERQAFVQHFERFSRDIAASYDSPQNN
jgi:DNA-binding MarR family transcriptional regulator